ncbi:MAG: glycosyltransferase family 2 protein [Acidobacteria bacterium]|nr:glycosyltransferase family 2 protein [Acidobacteriota bacterium]
MESELTVVIPTWNRRELLRNCLKSLEGQSQPCRVLVVDNGSSDGTVEMVRGEFPQTLLLPLKKNTGFARAVNLGIQESSTPYLATLNNDTEADPSWVEAGLYALKHHREYSMFASKLVNYFQRQVIDSAGDCYSRAGMPYKRGSGKAATLFTRIEPVLGASAGAAFFRRTLFDAIGMFDERFYMYLEDVDLSLRAQCAGYRCLFLPDAIVYHIEAASDANRRTTTLENHTKDLRTHYSTLRVYWITRNRWILMLTYQPLRNFPFLAAGWIRSALFHLIKVGFFWSFLRGLAAGLGCSRYALSKRRAILRKRAISSRDLCRLFRKCS